MVPRTRGPQCGGEGGRGGASGPPPCTPIPLIRLFTLRRLSPPPQQTTAAGIPNTTQHVTHRGPRSGSPSPSPTPVTSSSPPDHQPPLPSPPPTNPIKSNLNPPPVACPPPPPPPPPPRTTAPPGISTSTPTPSAASILSPCSLCRIDIRVFFFQWSIPLLAMRNIHTVILCACAYTNWRCT